MEQVKQKKEVEIYTKEGKKLYVYDFSTGSYSDYMNSTFVSETLYSKKQLDDFLQEFNNIKKEFDDMMHSAQVRIFKPKPGTEKYSKETMDEWREEYTKISNIFKEKYGIDNPVDFLNYLESKLDMKTFKSDQYISY